MEDFIEITLDISKHYGVSVDVYINENMTVKELVFHAIQGFDLTMISIENIVLKVERNAEILTQSEKLVDANVRNGDVLILA